MNINVKKTLVALVELIDRDKTKQVKDFQLAKAVSIDITLLQAHLKVLKDAKYVQIQKNHKGEEYFVPTFEGFEKAEVWLDELKKKSFIGMTSRAVKWALAGLAASLLGLIFWYFGLSPETSGLQPLSASVPIKVYDVGTYPPNVPSTTNWYAFSPSKAPVLVAGTKVNWQESNGLASILGDYSPATLNGDVIFRLAIENVAVNYQVDIPKVEIAVKQEAVNRITDLYFIPVQGLGGGGYWEYEVLVTPNGGDPFTNGRRIYPATITLDGESVDYIYVEPGKRETFEIKVKLDQPGKYELIPVITYSFRDKTENLFAQTYSVVYPLFYRSWVMEFGDGASTSDQLVTSHLIVDNQSGSIMNDSPSSIKQSICFPQRKWVFFTSTMIISGVLHQTFIIDSNGGNLRLLNSGYYDPRHELFVAWTNDGKVRLKYEDWIDQKQIYVYELFDPQTGEKLIWNEEVEKTILPGSETLNGYSSYFTSLNGQWIVSGDGKLQISSADGSCDYSVITPNYGEIWNISMQP
jgi:hypothetical protein